MQSQQLAFSRCMRSHGVLYFPDPTGSGGFPKETGYLLTADGMRQCAAYYLGEAGDPTDPYVSPLFADLAGLPPALVMTAEFDPLRDEGEAYARRLQQAGVPTQLRRWDGQIHGSQRMAKLLPAEAKEYHEILVGALRSAYDAAAR
jgi:acetyl esterase